MLGHQAPRFGAILQTFAALFWLAQAAAIAWAVQSLLENRGMAAAWPAALTVLLVGVIRSLVEAWGGRVLYRSARAHISSLRHDALISLATRSPQDTQRASSGEAASVLAEQAEALLPYLLRYLPVQQRVMILPLLIAAVTTWFSWMAALVLLFAAPLIPMFMALVGWQAKAAAEKQWVEAGAMNGFLLDRLRGLTTLRALDAVEHTAERLQNSTQSLRKRTMRVLRIAFLSSAVLELFSALGVALVAVYVGFHLLGYLNFGAWGARLSLGEGLFILLLAPTFFEPLRELSAVWHDRAAGTSAIDAMVRLTERGVSLPERRTAPPGSALLSLSELAVQHAGNQQPVFRGLSLILQSGEHLAVTGTSGCGKSTLLATIAGLLPVSAGNLSTTLKPGEIGWIGQRQHVFAGTVQANISLGRPTVDNAAVQQALTLARLHAVDQAHPRQMLGEGGVGLSGGEALRLALARIAADPSIQLILADEPTAHLDRQTAREITQALLELGRGRTLLVATHDPALAAALDRQMSLDELCLPHQNPRRTEEQLQPC